jgi:hypothetical protein
MFPVVDVRFGAAASLLAIGNWQLAIGNLKWTQPQQHRK